MVLERRVCKVHIDFLNHIVYTQLIRVSISDHLATWFYNINNTHTGTRGERLWEKSPVKKSSLNATYIFVWKYFFEWSYLVKKTDKLYKLEFTDRVQHVVIVIATVRRRWHP